MKRIVVAGATGLVGSAALRHFAAQPDCNVIALSRRAPYALHGASHVACNLADVASCRAASSKLAGATHLVYAALYEAPQLIAGWRDEEQIRINDSMLRNLMDVLLPVAPALQHVTLLQGTKAYGSHVRPIKVPARENRSEMREQPNFYWAQQDFLTQLQRGKSWHWTILRPVLIIGESMGGAMDLVPPLAVYAAIQRERGEPLHYPGGAQRVSQAVDVDLLARAIAWSGDSPNAQNEVFNVTNGDVFTWPNVWPAIAEAFGLEAAAPRPLSLGAQASAWRDEWEAIRKRRQLTAPALDAFVGLSLQYADYQMRYGETADGPPSIVSTVKINQAGFTETMDTELMFRKWIAHARERRWMA